MYIIGVILSLYRNTLKYEEEKHLLHMIVIFIINVTFGSKCNT